MCGLVGVAGDLSGTRKEVFTQMLLVDTLRGSHSTGVAAYVVPWDKHKSPEVLLEKLPLPGTIFCNTKVYDDLIRTPFSKILIGHNRYATIGEKTPENAHPFQFENVVGAHNGTIDIWSLKKLDSFEKFGTDSEALYYNIDKHGLQETIAKLTGAWALTWFNPKLNTVNMLRNSKRPLCYAYSEDRCTVFWSSEEDMLRWIVGRNNLKLFQDEVYGLEEDVHYRWTVPSSMVDKFEKPICAPCKSKAYSVSDNWKRANNDFYAPWSEYNDQWDKYNTQYIKPAATNVLAFPPKKVDTKAFRPPYKAHNNRIIGKKEFEEIVKHKCVFCQEDNSKWGDFVHLMKPDLDNRKIYMCKDCYDDDDIREVLTHCMDGD